MNHLLLFAQLPLAVQLVFGCLVGLLVGSYGNSVVHRLPRRILQAGFAADSAVAPPEDAGQLLHAKRSHCPHCRGLIAWYDNLPLVSWLLLRGRCRHCDAPIPVRYVLLEGMGAVIGLAATAAYGLTLQALLVAAVAFLTMWAAAIEREHGFVPLRLAALQAALGMVLVHHVTGSVLVSVAGAGCAALALMAGAFAVERLRQLGRAPWAASEQHTAFWRVLGTGAAPLVLALGCSLGAWGVLHAMVLAILGETLVRTFCARPAGAPPARWGVALGLAATFVALTQGLA